MSTQVQIRRGTTAGHSSFTGAVAELTFDTDLKTVRAHDGSTAGGTVLAKSSDVTAVSSNVSLKANSADLTTANVAEVTNLYYTVARANTAIDNRVNKSFIDALNVDADTLDGLDSTAFALDTDLTTANVTEITNLYYTVTRANAAIDDRVTKAFIDALNVDADTLDGNDSTYFAPISSPSLTGTPLAPTASAGTNTTQVATTAFVRTEVTNLIASAPSTLDTLNEIAAALGNDNNFSATIITQLGNKANTVSLTTANVTELTNLYYTDARVYSNVITIGYATNANVALKANLTDKLNVFGATSSEELRSVISDETGTGSLVFSASPTFTGTLSAAEISASGNVTSPYFYSQSDINLKKDVEPIVGALDIIKQLGGYNFKWKHNDAASIGLIAQYVEQVLPMLIGTAPDGSKTVLYNGIIALLLEAIKAQQVQIDEIKAKL